MNAQILKELLDQVKSGAVNVEEAVQKLRRLPFETLDFAHLDHHRALRCGAPEVIFCPGKTTEQIVEIFGRLAAQGQNVLATRTDRATFDAVAAKFPAVRFEAPARAIILHQQEEPSPPGEIVIVSAGTSDIPVAEEARVTAEILHQHVSTIFDVGVAGLHRLLSHSEKLQQANVIVVVAGMEGALASVVGGLVAVPVIAVPTSIGYGASFEGIAPLLTMLNSCAAGVATVNIDNGFGAGYLAALINRRTTEPTNG